MWNVLKCPQTSSYGNYCWQSHAAGVLYQHESHVIITESYFSRNFAALGGAIFAVQGLLKISQSSLHSHAASFSGGVLASLIVY